MGFDLGLVTRLDLGKRLPGERLVDDVGVLDEVDVEIGRDVLVFNGEAAERFGARMVAAEFSASCLAVTLWLLRSTTPPLRVSSDTLLSPSAFQSAPSEKPSFVVPVSPVVTAPVSEEPAPLKSAETVAALARMSPSTTVVPLLSSLMAPCRPLTAFALPPLM